jgi:hypothetical protein
MSSLISAPGRTSALSLKILLFGFVAGFLAVPFGHQVMNFVLYLLIEGRSFPWDMRPNPDAFGLPRMLNVAFWGGVWGMLWALLSPLMPRGFTHYVLGALFGAVCATLAGAYLVTAMKGLPPTRISWIGFLLNGAWGLTAAFLFDKLRERI